MCLSLTIKVLGTMVELALPYILSHIIQDVIKPMGAEVSPDLAAGSRRIVMWAVIMIICAFLGVLGNVTANRMAARTAKDVARAVRHDLFERTMRLSPAQTDAFTVESLESRLTGDTYNIHQFINSIQRMGVRAPILLIGGLTITVTLDPVLTLVMVAVLPFIFIAVYGITSRGLPLYTRVRGAVDSMTRVVREDAQGIRVIKALSKTDYECRRFDRENASLAAVERKTNATMSVANPLMNLFMNLGITAVVVVGAFRVNGGSSEPGKIIAFIQYFTLISMAMMSVSRIFLIISKASASANRIEEVLLTPEDLSVKPESEYPRRAEEGIVFDHVSFGYNGSSKEVVNDISFSLPKGGTLGIIGATGSGKTTLLSLLMRFYDVNEGSVRIDGRDVRTIPEHELHSMFGVAMQNDFICAISSSVYLSKSPSLSLPLYILSKISASPISIEQILLSWLQTTKLLLPSNRRLTASLPISVASTRSRSEGQPPLTTCARRANLVSIPVFSSKRLAKGSANPSAPSEIIIIKFLLPSFLASSTASIALSSSNSISLTTMIEAPTAMPVLSAI